MKIEASDTEILKLLKSGFLTIPRFQRPYSWAEDQLREFWADIQESEQGNYFIGSMVIYKDGIESFGVVDGQQRLTTVTILLCVVRDILRRLGANDLAQGVHNYVETTDRKNVKSFVLKTETSFPFLQDKIQRFGDSELDIEPGEEENKLKSAYEFFLKEVNSAVVKAGNGLLYEKERLDKSIEYLANLRDVVLQLKIIKVEMENEDDAYVIFETLNARGRDLQLIDLMKNVFGGMIVKNGDVDVFKEKWKGITDNLRLAGVAQKPDAFFVHSWASRYSSVTKQKAYKSVKDKLKADSVANGNERAVALSHLNHFLEDSRLYTWMNVPEDVIREKYKWVVRNSLSSLRIFNVEQQYPCVLSLIRAFDRKVIAYKTLRKALKTIENFHFKFNAITSSRSSGSIAAIYTRHARQLYRANTTTTAALVIQELTVALRERQPSEDEFCVGFRKLSYNSNKKSNSLLQYVLKRLSDAEALTYPLYQVPTIEHILPQSQIKGNWTPDLIHNIGNLILLGEAQNAQVENLDFDAKKLLYQQMAASIPASVLAAHDWTPDDVRTRATNLAIYAYRDVWRL
ncbi:DUF262 domain-containing HNH endonuclease family protein [Skermanella mucosa]|uniref:DUF262 domain-containing protein n=1 Tax=Skermanella mucosa TaxID=1789672 RepID=UPI00192BE50A|nr:DUF262 domain-containing protein [Skermanella mucosa]UEM20001.1 DUF262 domain-containing HNH endonuclease family protein [Skermanella mucosa]